MFLSLFLLLLAFFILLNALSTFEEAKARMVIKSVTSTFKTELVEKKKAQIFISTLGAVPEPREVMGQIEQMWVTAVPLVKVDALNEGSMMQMTLATKELFVVGEAAIRPDRVSILNATATALMSELPDSLIELQLTFGVRDIDRVKTTKPEENSQLVTEEIADPNLLAPVNRNEDRSLAFIRAGVVARYLEDTGVEPHSISVGLREINPKELRMRFFVRPKDEAFNDFSQLVENNSGDSQ
ncbi:MAG: hypothetical protein R3261_02860 [Alphaproteobacteria bacterium]|nr:hypothetical protein [Alphaproteobacteria bacterium]